MGDAARAQAVASKSCLYMRNGLEISVPFFDSGLSDWLLNLHVAAGDWPIFTVGCTKIFGPSQTSVFESFTAGHGPSERQAHARNERRLFFASHANGRHCSRRARSAHATPISEIIEMNGTSHLTVSPAPTGPTPAPRASPVARRLCLGSDVSAFWRLAITRRIVAHLPRPSLPPSAASKLLALFVALVALATANAATWQGSVGGGYQYTDVGTTLTTEAGFASSISTASFSGWTTRATYDSTFKSHVDTVAAANGATWQAFKTLYGGDADFIGKYVDLAAVSPISRPKPPKYPNPRNATTTS